MPKISSDISWNNVVNIGGISLVQSNTQQRYIQKFC